MTRPKPQRSACRSNLNNRTIETGEMIKIDENTIQMDIVYNSGETATLTGIKEGQNVTYYMDGQLVSQTTIAELEKNTSDRIIRFDPRAVKARHC